MQYFALAAGALLGLTGVLLGAYFAHGLDQSLARGQMDSLLTANRYQIFHALLLLVLGLLYRNDPAGLLTAAIWTTLIGTLLFAGSIYLLVLAGMKQRVVVLSTPVGGLSLIIGWGLLFLNALLRAWQGE